MQMEPNLSQILPHVQLVTQEGHRETLLGKPLTKGSEVLTSSRVDPCVEVSITP